jgi:hypothetical protein
MWGAEGAVFYAVQGRIKFCLKAVEKSIFCWMTDNPKKNPTRIQTNQYL